MKLAIPDMNCGHCRASVTRALTELDPAARIEIDLPAREAAVETSATPATVIATLKAIGFDARTL